MTKLHAASTANPHVTIIVYDAHSIEELPLVDLGCPVFDLKKTTWYDVRGLQDKALVQTVGTLFGMHNLLIEDVLDIYQRPKVDELENSLFVKATAHRLEDNSIVLQNEQISFYLTDHALVCFQEDAEDLFPDLRKRLFLPQSRTRLRGPDFLLYTLMDSMADGYYVILDKYEQQITILENEIDRGAHAKQKAKIHLLKRELSILRRSVVPLRDAVLRIQRSGHATISSENEMYYRDLNDHLREIVDECDSFREQLNSLYDLYLSEIAIKTNSVIQVLTIISTIFMPLTFVVGIYGMNFRHMPELEEPWGYPLVMILMAVVVVVMLFYFKRKRWL